MSPASSTPTAPAPTAQTERKALSALLLQVGPHAPTLCEGWDTHALASHLWVRENDPLGAVGIVASPLAQVTERRMAAVRERWDFADLVGRLAGGPPRLSLFGLPGVDRGANTVEFWVHHEDVRRAGSDPAGPRATDPSFEARIWRQLRLLGKAMFRQLGTDGLVLEEPGGDRLRIRPGRATVTVLGPASELLLYGFGRTAVARVELIGEPVTLSALPQPAPEVTR